MKDVAPSFRHSCIVNEGFLGLVGHRSNDIRQRRIHDSTMTIWQQPTGRLQFRSHVPQQTESGMTT